MAGRRSALRCGGQGKLALQAFVGRARLAKGPSLIARLPRRARKRRAFSRLFAVATVGSGARPMRLDAGPRLDRTVDQASWKGGLRPNVRSSAQSIGRQRFFVNTKNKFSFSPARDARKLGRDSKRVSVATGSANRVIHDEYVARSGTALRESRKGPIASLIIQQRTRMVAWRSLRALAGDGEAHPVPSVVHVAFEVPDVLRLFGLGVGSRVPRAHANLVRARR